jgi:hypothetical protein
MSRLLHVANGTSVTNTLAETGIPGLRSIWADPLHEGPVPGGLTDDELVAVRMRYLLGDQLPQSDHWNDLRRWRKSIDSHASYDELILWFEHDLFDQLNLIQLLSYVRGRLPAEKAVTLICIHSFPGHPEFHGLGELTAPELASLFGARRPVTDAEYLLAGRAWQAFREPTPEALDQLRQSDTSAMPYLARSLQRFLENYPAVRDGLSRSERRLLELAAEGLTLARAFPRMNDGEDAYYISDVTFMGLIGELSGTSPPLLTVAERTLMLTAEGRDVLAGRRDRVSYGLDRWMGGVHLKSGETPIWRWDEASGKCLASNPSSGRGRNHQ